jgi:2,4-didehydro-3-deoxy-L-rhamnonate hydrolase
MIQFVRYGASGLERPALLEDGRAYSLESLTSDLDGEFIGRGGLDSAVEALAANALPEIRIDGERLGAPIARPPAIICIGQNYAAHAAESGSAPPSTPIVFFKHPSSLCGPFDEVSIPPGSLKTDWEVELAVVIGRTVRYLGEHEDPLDYVAGYTVANDVSERDYQIEQSGGQWSKGKSAETFNPLGPYLVPATEIPDPQNLGLRSWVNGEARQDSSSADMIFDVAFLVRHLSHYMKLQPGDIINTGTPQGVALSGRFPYLKAGDTMTMEIDGLGAQRQVLVDAS